MALCEIELELNLGIERCSIAKQTAAPHASVEMLIAMARYSHAVANKQIAAAFRLGLLAVNAYSAVRGSKDRDTNSSPTSEPTIQALLQNGLADIVRTIPIDLLVWHRCRDEWSSELVANIEKACVELWGDSSAIADIIAAASGMTLDHKPAASVALAAHLGSMPDLRGDPRARFNRDLLFVTHAAHSLARRVLEPLVVTYIADGWSIVLRDETFALRSPIQHAGEIRSALDQMKSSGLKGAAQLMIAAAPAVGRLLSGSWEQLLRQIIGSAENVDR